MRHKNFHSSRNNPREGNRYLNRSLTFPTKFSQPSFTRIEIIFSVAENSRSTKKFSRFYTIFYELGMIFQNFLCESQYCSSKNFFFFLALRKRSQTRVLDSTHSTQLISQSNFHCKAMWAERMQRFLRHFSFFFTNHSSALSTEKRKYRECVFLKMFLTWKLENKLLSRVRFLNLFIKQENYNDYRLITFTYFTFSVVSETIEYFSTVEYFIYFKERFGLVGVSRRFYLRSFNPCVDSPKTFNWFLFNFPL